jgi:AraC-like DNA-binding protein
VKFIRSKYTWRIVGAFSDEKGCLEKLAFRKGYRVGDICAALGCSQRHLYSVFLRDIGLPPKKWVDLERMVVARRMLEGEVFISKVAGDLGYTSVVAFGRRFERIYGVPPGRFVKCRRVFDPRAMERAEDSPTHQ